LENVTLVPEADKFLGWDAAGEKLENKEVLEPTIGLPTLTGNAGKALVVNDSATAFIYRDYRDTTYIRAHLSSNQSIPPDPTFTKIQFDTIDADDLFEFDNITNHRGVLTFSGDYAISAAAGFLTVGADTVYRLVIANKGVFITDSIKHTSINENYTNSITIFSRLAAGDFIEVFAFHSGVGSKNIQGQSNKTFLEIRRIL